MDTTRRRILLASTTLALTVGACKDGGSSLIDRGSCDVLIECAASLAPESRDGYEAAYGPDGSCFASADPRAWALCRDACAMTLDSLNQLAMLTGDTCGTCSSDADCSSFGAGASCDGGFCVGGDGMAEGGTSGDPSGDGDPTGDGDPSGDGDGDVPLTGVSILLVVDNSGSMGDAQQALITQLPALVAPLDAAAVPWRLGVTTTDNGNSWCPAGQTTPEAGKLVFSACTTRLNDFLFGQDVDVQDVCTDACGLNSVTTVPTTTGSDATATPRPWIESSGGQTNLAGGVSVTDALRCVVPQGVNGCGFESQLESAYLAVARAGSPEEPQYGFVEDGRLLVVVFVTDEADCSYNKNWGEIFSVDGSKAFWSDPTAAFPTSAVCWNAGVECVGDPSNYSSCEPADKNVNGGPAANADDAVLLPIARYLDGLQSAGPVLTFGLVGVGDDGEPFYADVGNVDPQFQTSFGIGPGCTASGPNGLVTAIPPVRMRAVLDQLGPAGGQAAYSICDADFGGGLGAIGATVAAQF